MEKYWAMNVRKNWNIFSVKQYILTLLFGCAVGLFVIYVYVIICVVLFDESLLDYVWNSSVAHMVNYINEMSINNNMSIYLISLWLCQKKFLLA